MSGKLYFLEVFFTKRPPPGFCSVYDVVSDFFAGLEYFEGITILVSVSDLNDIKVTNLTSSHFLNATARICSLELEENGMYNFSCVEHHYWYGIMTFVFIYATSGMTLAAPLLSSDLNLGLSRPRRKK